MLVQSSGLMTTRRAEKSMSSLPVSSTFGAALTTLPKTASRWPSEPAASELGIQTKRTTSCSTLRSLDTKCAKQPQSRASSIASRPRAEKATVQSKLCRQQREEAAVQFELRLFHCSRSRPMIILRRTSSGIGLSGVNCTVPLLVLYPSSSGRNSAT